MDKVRARLKALKRAEREREKADREQKIINDFNAYCNKCGVKNVWSRQKILRTQREIEKELEIEANLICVVASAYVLHKLYGFGKKRLFTFCYESHERIVNAYNGERSAYQFADELKHETGIVTKDYFTIENKPKPTGTQDYIERVNAIWSRLPVVLNIALYGIYWRFGFRNKRMKRVCETVCDVIRRILQENSLKRYMLELEQCGLIITMKGQFKAKISDEEYERMIK